MSHIHEARASTGRLIAMARYDGRQGDQFGAAVTLYTRWMQVSAPDAVKDQLAAALAEMHSEAG